LTGLVVTVTMRIVIGYTDGAEYVIGYFQKTLPGLLRSFISERTELKLVWEHNPTREPDILIYSIFGKRHGKYQKCIKICYCGEPNDISAKIPSHHLLLDCKVHTGRVRLNGYLPFYIMSFFERIHHTPRDLIKTQSVEIGSKTRFCAFLYHHEIPFRNEFYRFLSQYKPVDALGKCENPRVDELALDRKTYDKTTGTYNDLAVQKYLPYKFVICCENSIHPGYITEKLVNAMLARAIPIYFGAPDVVQHFNEKSFINVNSFNNLDDVLKRVQEIDENEALYQQVLNEPWLTGNQLSSWFRLDYLKVPFQDLIMRYK